MNYRNQHQHSTDYNDILTSLHHYMLTPKLISKLSISEIQEPRHMDTDKNITNNRNGEHSNKDTISKSKQEEIFFPKENDMLFWCYFIIVNGMEKYEVLHTQRFLVEKEEKLKCIQLIRDHKKDLIAKKIRNRDLIEDDLVNSKKISLKTFVSLCIVSNINVMIVNKRKYYEICCNVDEKDNVVLLHHMETPFLKYGYEMINTEDKLKIYRDNYFLCHSIENPLKAVSSYKSSELKDICKKLKIDENATEKKTKQQLYQMVLDHL